MPDELTPSTNIEKFLAKTAGESVELPEPATRIEKYLSKIASEQTITEATDNWLDEHIDPSTGYVLDRTLAMQNAAAPADMVGDLKSAIDSGIKYWETNWNDGRISATDGSIYQEAGWVTSDLMEFEEESTIFTDFDNFLIACQICLYNSDGTIMVVNNNKQIAWIDGNPYSLASGQKFRFTIKRTKEQAKKCFKVYTNEKKIDRILENAMWQTDTNNEPKAFTSDFFIGNMSSGNYFPLQKYRIHTGLMKYNSKVAIDSLSGYRFFVIYYEDGVYISSSSSITHAEIPANQEFILIIRRETETSAYADPDIFKRQVKFSDVIENEITSVYSLPWMYNGRMRIAGHMGKFNGYIEPDVLYNSVPGFINAGVNKLFMCESDIRETSDGYFVMIHDATVDSTTDGTGTVSQMTLAELRALHLKRTDGTYGDDQIPTFEEYLQICKQYQMIALCELKSVQDYSSIENIFDIIKSYGMQNQFCFIGTKYDVPHIRQYTDVPISLLATVSDAEAITLAKSYSNIIYDIDYTTATEAFIKTMHGFGIPVIVYVVNTKSDADSMWNIGVDFVCTNLLTEADWIN